MNVGLDESGQEVAALRVDHAVVAPRGQVAHHRDPPVANQQRTIDDLETIVHRDDRRVPD
jgi:hypothetical protein